MRPPPGALLWKKVGSALARFLLAPTATLLGAGKPLAALLPVGGMHFGLLAAAPSFALESGKVSSAWTDSWRRQRCAENLSGRGSLDQPEDDG